MKENIWGDFPKYKKLLNFIAWKQSSSYNDFEDNKSEIIITYVEAMDQFDPTAKTSKKSFLGKCAKNHLSHKNREKRKEVFFEDLFAQEGCDREDFYSPWETKTPETYLCFKESLNSLSKNAQEVIRIILDAPKETWDIINGFNRKSNRANLIEYIRWEYEWGYNKIWKIFQEIKEKIIF